MEINFYQINDVIKRYDNVLILIYNNQNSFMSNLIIHNAFRLYNKILKNNREFKLFLVPIATFSIKNSFLPLLKIYKNQNLIAKIVGFKNYSCNFEQIVKILSLY